MHHHVFEEQPPKNVSSATKYAHSTGCVISSQVFQAEIFQFEILSPIFFFGFVRIENYESENFRITQISQLQSTLILKKSN